MNAVDGARTKDLVVRMRASDRAAIAHALNTIESRAPQARAEAAALLAELRSASLLDAAHRVGITGPPGVGKSTLLAALARGWRAEQKSVGILAVDPSSIKSGGALLGDRLRIAPDPNDTRIFVRSLATRGALGGLAESVPMSLLVLAAAFDIAVVETVGVGQTETDVAHVADTVVFVVQPGSGDALQFLKAGIMELPDVLVVNKADQGKLADRARAELTAAVVSLSAAGIGSRAIPIVATSATTGDGVEVLARAIADHRASLAAAGELAPRRRAGAIASALRAFARRFGEIGVEARGGEETLAVLVAAEIDAGRSLLAVLDALGFASK